MIILVKYQTDLNVYIEVTFIANEHLDKNDYAVQTMNNQLLKYHGVFSFQ